LSAADVHHGRAVELPLRATVVPGASCVGTSAVPTAASDGWTN
jgi:hypothetical protein